MWIWLLVLDTQTSKMQFSHTFRLFRRFSTSFFVFRCCCRLLLLLYSPLSCLHRLYCYVMVVIFCIHSLLLCIHIYRYIEKVIFYFVNFRPFVLVWLHRGWCKYCRRGQIIRDKQIDWLTHWKQKATLDRSLYSRCTCMPVRWNLQLKTPYIALHKFLGRRLLWKLFNINAFYLVCLFVAFFSLYFSPKT